MDLKCLTWSRVQPLFEQHSLIQTKILAFQYSVSSCGVICFAFPPKISHRSKNPSYTSLVFCSNVLCYIYHKDQTLHQNSYDIHTLALTDYVSRAHEIEIRLSSVRPSVASIVSETIGFFHILNFLV